MALSPLDFGVCGEIGDFSSWAEGGHQPPLGQVEAGLREPLSPGPCGVGAAEDRIPTFSVKRDLPDLSPPGLAIPEPETHRPPRPLPGSLGHVPCRPVTPRPLLFLRTPRPASSSSHDLLLLRPQPGQHPACWGTETPFRGREAEV